MERRRRRNAERYETHEIGTESERSDYSIFLDASHQSKSIPTLPIFGASRLTCVDAGENKKNSEFVIPGRVIIKNADKINGCVLQMRILIADKKDSRGKPLFFDVKIDCPDFEPTTAFVNGKQTKMSIQ